MILNGINQRSMRGTKTKAMMMIMIAMRGVSINTCQRNSAVPLSSTAQAILRHFGRRQHIKNSGFCFVLTKCKQLAVQTRDLYKALSSRSI
jgi:hypothetical protein